MGGMSVRYVRPGASACRERAERRCASGGPAIALCTRGLCEHGRPFPCYITGLPLSTGLGTAARGRLVAHRAQALPPAPQQRGGSRRECTRTPVGRVAWSTAVRISASLACCQDHHEPIVRECECGSEGRLVDVRAR
eukprot:scaffold6650_cov65-Phaeocystis_antarctica.AAC.3